MKFPSEGNQEDGGVDSGLKIRRRVESMLLSFEGGGGKRKGN